MNVRTALGGALAFALALIAFAPTAGAEYATVQDDAVQWEWASIIEPGRFQVTDVAVRDDGWMLVATATFADGYLHLIPPWGGALDWTTRLGTQTLGFRQIELRRGRLFGLRQEHQRRDEDTHNAGELIELDAETGEVIRHHGSWWFQDLALDPVTDDLVLQISGSGREPYRHDLVRYNPDRGTLAVLVVDDEPRSDRAFEVAFSDDGELLFTANVTDVPVTVDVRRRDGTSLHTLQSGQVDALVAGRSGTCFEDRLVLTRFDGSVLTMATTPGSTPVPIAAGGRTGVVSYAALDRDGHVATSRYADVTLVACPGFVPPVAPTKPAVPAAAPPVADGPAAPAPGPPVSTPPTPASGPPPATAAPAAPPPPAPATPAVPVAPPSALSGAAQAASAPSVGAADAPEEEHLTSIAASHRSTLAVSVGAVVAMAMVAYVLAAPPSTVRLHRVRGTP